MSFPSRDTPLPPGFPPPLSSLPADRQVRVAVDAMGGDRGLEVVVGGAVAAAREWGIPSILVGQEEEIAAHLTAHRGLSLPLSLCHAPEAVEMDEAPAATVRKKRHSSLRVGLDLVKQGKAEAFVSAGNTGAIMATAALTLGLLPEVERPAIALCVPTPRGRSVVLDVGANVDSKPRHLLQFAIMGHIYARDVLGLPSPRVGLLNIGEEETKGNELTKEAFKALEEDASLNFIGNVEGCDLFAGTADVIVCDGFVGNVSLKVSESVAEVFSTFLREEISRSLVSRLGYVLARPAFQRFRRRADYSEYGGLPLLGVDGVCIIAHGRSSARAIKNAIRAAAECVHNKVIQHIREGLARL